MHLAIGWAHPSSRWAPSHVPSAWPSGTKPCVWNLHSVSGRDSQAQPRSPGNVLGDENEHPMLGRTRATTPTMGAVVHEYGQPSSLLSVSAGDV